MTEPRIEVESTSLRTAAVTPVLLRGGDQTRLVFKPDLVENRNEPAASVRGTFVWQRKRKAEEWEDVETVRLNTLRSGEGFKLELSSSEVLELHEALCALYELMRESKGRTPVGKRIYVRIDPGDALERIVGSLDQEGASDLIEVFADWLGRQDRDALAEAIGAVEYQQLLSFDAALGVARLRRFLSDAETHLGDSQEGYWQRLLTENAWVLSQVYAYPLVIVREQAYVGGKGIDNAGGTITDYLYRNALSLNAVVVEIKTPTAPLLTRDRYRNGVYGPDAELANATQQVLNACRTLENNYAELTRGRADEFTVFSPRALLVVGVLPTDAEMRRSFELYRNNLRNVEVVTFDELIEKARLLLAAIEGR